MPNVMPLSERVLLRRLADRTRTTEPPTSYAAGYRDAMVDVLRWVTGAPHTLDMERAAGIPKSLDFPHTAAARELADADR